MKVSFWCRGVSAQFCFRNEDPLWVTQTFKQNPKALLQHKLMDFKQISKLNLLQGSIVRKKTKNLAPEFKCKVSRRQKYVIKSFVSHLINQAWISQAPVVFVLIL